MYDSESLRRLALGKLRAMPTLLIFLLRVLGVGYSVSTLCDFVASCSMSMVTIIQDVKGDYTGPKAVDFFGVRQPSFVPYDPNFKSSLPRFETRPDDVWIGSYPKSGTAWLSEVVWQVMNGGSANHERIDERVYFLEASKLLTDADPTDDRPALDSRESPRLLHSHLPYHVIPMSRNEETRSKYIYIARNPKDVVVSYFHFMESFGEQAGFRGPFEFLVELFLDGKAHYGLWHEHVLEWWRRRDDPNLLFLKYEDMKKNLEGEVKKVAMFLEKSLTDGTIKRITRQCTFHEMAKDMTKYWVYDKDGPRRLRKGKVGDWKNYFTPALNRAFEEKILSKLDGSGLKFEFE